MKYYCPKCRSYSVFLFWKPEKLQEWAVCRNCWHKKPSDQFRIDYDDGSWDRADDWVHEHKTNLKMCQFENLKIEGR